MSNLLDKSSLVLTPTAYDNGKLLSVKPTDGIGDFDFTRNSSATRVNSEGLIEDVQILSSNLVSNGDFSQEGSELITNGDFATDSDWTKQTSWSISGGAANYDFLSDAKYIRQTLLSGGFVAGKAYKINFEITSGTAYMNVSSNGGGLISLNTYSVGSYSIYVIASASGSDLLIYGRNTSGTAFSIDNVSVKEVGQDWTFGTGWSIGEDKATVDNTVNANLDQFISGFSGKKVKVSFEISDLSSGGILVGDIVNPGAYNATSNGIHTFDYTATNSTFRVRAYGNPCSITNISVLEITDDTNLPRINYEGFSYQDALGSELVTNGDFSDGTNGWNAAGGGSISVSNNQLTLEGNNDFNFYARQTVSGYEVGKQYRIEVDVAGGSTSKMQVGIYGEGLFFDNQPIVLGKLSAIFTITNGSNGSRFLDIINRNDDGLNDTLIINSVSVKEYLGQEVVPDSGVGSWLFEPQSTNLLFYSEDFSNAVWTKSNSSVTSGFISPDGTANAFKLVENSSNSSHYVFQSSQTQINSYSVFVKKGEKNWVLLTSHGTSAPTARGQFFDLENGIVGQGGEAIGKIEDYGNGWYRISTEPNAPSSLFTIMLADGDGIFSYQGNGTDGVYIWGAQNTDTNLTSYIPTNGSTATRLQDAAFGAGSSDLINSTEGVLYFEGSALTDTDTTNPNRGISISSGSTNNTIFIYYQAALNTLACILISNGTTQFSHSTSLFDVDDYLKIALKYKQNDFALWVNGTEIATDTSGNAPIGLNELAFDNGVGNDKFYGKAKCVAVFKEALTDEELTCLTTI